MLSHELVNSSNTSCVDEETSFLRPRSWTDAEMLSLIQKLQEVQEERADTLTLRTADLAEVTDCASPHERSVLSPSIEVLTWGNPLFNAAKKVSSDTMLLEVMGLELPWTTVIPAAAGTHSSCCSVRIATVTQSSCVVRTLVAGVSPRWKRRPFQTSNNVKLNVRDASALPIGPRTDGELVYLEVLVGGQLWQTNGPILFHRLVSMKQGNAVRQRHEPPHAAICGAASLGWIPLTCFEESGQGRILVRSHFIHPLDTTKSQTLRTPTTSPLTSDGEADPIRSSPSLRKSGSIYDTLFKSPNALARRLFASHACDRASKDNQASPSCSLAPLEWTEQPIPEGLSALDAFLNCNRVSELATGDDTRTAADRVMTLKWSTERGKWINHRKANAEVDDTLFLVKLCS